MPVFDAVPKSGDDRRTPNWRQTLWLLCGGLVLGVGSCGAAVAVFSVGYGSQSRLLVALWWALIAVFAISLVAFLVGLVFLLIMAIRAVARSARSSSGDQV